MGKSLSKEMENLGSVAFKHLLLPFFVGYLPVVAVVGLLSDIGETTQTVASWTGTATLVAWLGFRCYVGYYTLTKKASNLRNWKANIK